MCKISATGSARIGPGSTDWRTPPARLNVRTWYNPNLESQWFIVPGIVGLLTLVVTLVVTALSVAREREAGTFDQLLVTPLRPLDILLGKALPGMLIGLVEEASSSWLPFCGLESPFTAALRRFIWGSFCSCFRRSGWA